jgi:hypothetical protein
MRCRAGADTVGFVAPYDEDSSAARSRRPPSGRPQPRYGRFIGTGAVLGFVVAAIVAVFAPRSERYESSDVLFYVGVLTVMIGGLIGGGVAVLVDLSRGREGRRSA